ISAEARHFRPGQDLHAEIAAEHAAAPLACELNRAAECIYCQIKYPDRARRRGVEGTALIAIDTDDSGIVTQVRLIRSSGDSELDEAAEKYAQDWKLTPKEGGREAVTTEVNFIIKGSQLYRKRQENQRQKSSVGN
ncbi:MAG: energy transducer TonB, partial [Dolichospermum sp.]